MSAHRARRGSDPSADQATRIESRDEPGPVVLHECPHCYRSIGPILATDLRCPRRQS